MPLVSSAELRAALATTLGGVEGITKAFAWKPKDLLPHELPAAVLSPQTARYTYPSAQEVARGRTWQVLVFVKKAESGTEYAAEVAAEAALDVVIDGLMGYQRIILTDQTFAYVRLEEDTHVVRMPFGPDTYAGFILTLRLSDDAYFAPVSN